MSHTVAIMQPTYLPWCGYINMIDSVDQFVLYDTVQFTHKTWQHRNRIRARDGNLVWLTIPTQAPHRQPISSIRIADDTWRAKHWRTIQSAYTHTPHWHELRDMLEPTYDTYWHTLADLTTNLIRDIAGYLNITTRITRASDMPDMRTGKLERIEDTLRAIAATHFLEPIAVGDLHILGLLPPTRIADAKLIWHHYTPVEYQQGNMPWQPYLSVIDLIAWHGRGALDIIRSGEAPQLNVVRTLHPVGGTIITGDPEQLLRTLPRRHTE
jgi:hypothetical protein